MLENILITLGTSLGWLAVFVACVIGYFLAIPGDGKGTPGLGLIRWTLPFCALLMTAISVTILVKTWS